MFLPCTQLSLTMNFHGSFLSAETVLGLYSRLRFGCTGKVVSEQVSEREKKQRKRKRKWIMHSVSETGELESRKLQERKRERRGGERFSSFHLRLVLLHNSPSRCTGPSQKFLIFLLSMLGESCSPLFPVRRYIFHLIQ